MGSAPPSIIWQISGGQDGEEIIVLELSAKTGF